MSLFLLFLLLFLFLMMTMMILPHWKLQHLHRYVRKERRWGQRGQAQGCRRQAEGVRQRPRRHVRVRQRWSRIPACVRLGAE